MTLESGTKKVELSESPGVSNQNITPHSPKAIILTSAKQHSPANPSPKKSPFNLNSIIALQDLSLVNNLALIPIQRNPGKPKQGGSQTERGGLMIDTMYSDRRAHHSIDPNDPLNFENVDFFFMKKKKLLQSQKNKQIMKGHKLTSVRLREGQNQSNSSQKGQGSDRKEGALGSGRSSERGNSLEVAQQLKIQQLNETITKRPLQGLPAQVQNQEAMDRFFEGFTSGQPPPGAIEKDLLLMDGARQYINKKLEGIVTHNQAQEADIMELFEIYQKQFNAQRRYKQRWQWWGEAKTSKDSKLQTHAVAVQKFDVGTGIENQYDDEFIAQTEKRSPQGSMKDIDASALMISKKASSQIRQLESAKRVAIARVREGSNIRLDQSPQASIHKSLNVSGKALETARQLSGLKASPLLNESLIRDSDSEGSLRRGKDKNESQKVQLFQRNSPGKKYISERFVTENVVQIQDVNIYDPRESLNYLSLSILTPAQLKGLYDSHGKDQIPISEDHEGISAGEDIQTHEKHTPGLPKDKDKDSSSTKRQMLKSISKTHKDVLSSTESPQRKPVDQNIIKSIKPVKQQSSNSILDQLITNELRLQQQVESKETSEAPIQPRKPRVSLRRPVAQRSPQGTEKMHQTGFTEKNVQTLYSQSKAAQDYTEFSSIQIKQLQAGPSQKKVFGESQFGDPSTALLLNEHQSTLPLKRRQDNQTENMSEIESPYFRTKRAAFLPTQIMVQGQPWETGDSSPRKQIINVYNSNRKFTRDKSTSKKKYQIMKNARNSHTSMYQSVDHFISQKYRQQVMASKKQEYLYEKRTGKVANTSCSRNTGSSQDARKTISQGSQARDSSPLPDERYVSSKRGGESDLSSGKVINVKTLELEQPIHQKSGFFINANELGDLSKINISIDEPALISKNLPSIGQSHQFKVKFNARNHAKGRYESSLGNYADHITQPSTRLGMQFRHSMDVGGEKILMLEKQQRRASAAQEDDQRELLRDFLSSSDYQSFGLLNPQLKPTNSELKKSFRLSIGNEKVTEDSWLPQISQNKESRAQKIKAYAKDMHKFNYKKWLGQLESKRSSNKSQEDKPVHSGNFSPDSTYRRESIDSIPYKTKQPSIYGCPKGGSALSTHKQYVRSVVKQLGCDDSKNRSPMVKQIEQKQEAMAIMEQMSQHTDSNRKTDQFSNTERSFQIHQDFQQKKRNTNNQTLDVDTRLPSNRYLLVSQSQNSDLDNKFAELKNHLIHAEENSVVKLERKRKLKHALNQQYVNEKKGIDLSYRNFLKAQGIKCSQTIVYDEKGVFQNRGTKVMDGQTQRTLGKKVVLKHPPLPDKLQRIDFVSKVDANKGKVQKANPFRANQTQIVSRSLHLQKDKPIRIPNVNLEEVHIRQKSTQEDRTATTANAQTQSLSNKQSNSPSGMHVDLKTNLLMQPRTDIASSMDWAGDTEVQRQDAALSSARNFDTSRSGGGKSQRRLDQKVKILKAFPVGQKGTDVRQTDRDKRVIELIQKQETEKKKKESKGPSSQISSQMKIDFNIRSLALGAKFSENKRGDTSKGKQKESVQSILLEGHEIEASSVRDFDSPIRHSQGSRERTENISHDTKAQFFSTKKNNMMYQTIPIDDSQSPLGPGDPSYKKPMREMNGLNPWLKELAPPKVSFKGTIKASGYQRKRNYQISPEAVVRIKKGPVVDWSELGDEQKYDNYLYRHYMRIKK